MQTLIEDQGMSADAKDDNGYTAIHAAASWAHPSLLRYLLSKGGNINITDNDGECVYERPVKSSVAWGRQFSHHPSRPF